MDQQALENARSLGFAVEYETGDDNAIFSITRLKVPQGIDTVAAMRTLKIALPGQVVALNSLYRIYAGASGQEETILRAATPAGCSAESCKPFALIGWKPSLRDCSHDLPIGMIDTGLDLSHPALASGAAARRIVTRDFVEVGLRTAPTGHGTAVASLLMGDARGGVAGLVPDVKLYAANTFHADGDQSVTSTVNLLKALRWMQTNGVRIVNMSFAGPEDDLLHAAILKAQDDGMIIVAAAGNEGADAPPAYPAAYDDVIAVTAVSADLKPYQRANHGTYIKLSAPGVHIWAAAANGKGAFESGTSFAAPYVTALAATVIRAAGLNAGAKAVLDSIPYHPIGNAASPAVFGRGLAFAPSSCSAVRTAEQLPWTPGSKQVAESLPWTPSGTTVAFAKTGSFAAAGGTDGQ